MQRRSGPDEATRARLLGKRTALVGCGVIAVWFCVSSVAQLAAALFGAGVAPIAVPEPASSSSPEWRCADGLRRAGALVTPPPPEGVDAAAQGRTLDPDAVWSCSQSSAGLDALAAYRRLELAQTKLGPDDPASVAELRRALSAHLPAQMR
ncbi:MAG: hypothetical protein ACRENE_17080 [Polyangiaceae bacterium]